MKDYLILIGIGGHARVLLEAADSERFLWLGYLNIVPHEHESGGLPYLGKDEVAKEYCVSKHKLVNGVGSVSSNDKRAEIYQRFKKIGFSFQKIIHSSAIVSCNVTLGEGCQIMAGAIIQSGAVCGENVIINTKASVDHDCVIGAGAHVSVGATLSGNVLVGNSAFIGAGSTIKQGIILGEGCVVAAGAVVVNDVPERATVMGVPARIVVDQ